MTVESATYINDLNSAYPAFGDVKAEGDDHIRLIKAVLKASLPNIAGIAFRSVVKTGAGPHSLSATDNISVVAASHTAQATVNLPAPATAGNGWFVLLYNYGTGNMVLTPASGTINGAATLAVEPGAGALVWCSGTLYGAFGIAYTKANATHLAGMLPVSATPDVSTIMARSATGETVVRRLGISGDATRQDLVFYDRDQGGDYWQMFMNAGNLYWTNSVAGVDRMILDQSGNLYLDADVIGFYSDERLKRNVENLKYRAQDIWHIRPVRFEWNNHRLAKEEGKVALGFIAQEVRQWCPEAVEEREDPRTPGETYLWVNYEMLVPVAFQIIKDLENKVRGLDRFVLPRVEQLTKLEERIATLEARIAALEAGNAAK